MKAALALLAVLAFAATAAAEKASETGWARGVGQPRTTNDIAVRACADGAPGPSCTVMRGLDPHIGATLVSNSLPRDNRVRVEA